MALRSEDSCVQPFPAIMKGAPVLMLIGFSAANITPSYGMEVPGGMSKRSTRGLHDDCLMTAAVFDDGRNTVALVGVDALSVRHSMCEQARAIIEEATGIPPEHVMFGASHTHSGGPSCRLFESDSDPAYLEHMARQGATAVIDANRRKRELRLGVGVGEAKGVAFPRRWIMKDGTQRSHPAAERENMDHPQGELDESVTVIGVADADDVLRGCVVNFTCHGTTGYGAGMASADWIAVLRADLQAVFGPEFGVVFLQGACGDVTQVDNTQPPDTPWSGPQMGRKIGGAVAGEAVKLLTQMRFEDTAPVAGKRVGIDLEPRRPTEEQLAWAREHLGGREPNPNRWGTDGIWAREWLNLAKINKEEPVVPCELQAIVIGDTVFAGNPGEFFCKLGVDIKRGSPFAHTVVVELANGCVGYVPTEDAYEGGYESQMAPSSKLMPGSGEKIVAETLKLLAQF